MGDIADMMLEGILCEQCGVYIDDRPPGHPRLCRACARDEARRELEKLRQEKGKRRKP